MTFHLTEDQATIQQLARDLPRVSWPLSPRKLDQEERNSQGDHRENGGNRFHRPQCPRAYGGPELDTVCKVLVVSELAKQCASTAEVIAVHTLVNDIFLEHGSEAQKQKYLTAAVEEKSALRTHGARSRL